MANPAKKTIQLFYDVVSPYSWFAFEILCRYKTKWPIELQLKPIFNGGLLAGIEGLVSHCGVYSQKTRNLEHTKLVKQ